MIIHIQAKRKRPESAELAGGLLPLGWVAISTQHYPDTAFRRKNTTKLWKITSIDGSASIYRTMVFSSKPCVSKDSESNDWGVVLDYAGWVELANGINDNEAVPDRLKLELRPAVFWEQINLMYSHPDPSFRLASAISIVSLTVSFWEPAWEFLKWWASILFGR